MLPNTQKERELSHCWAEELAEIPSPDWLIEGILPSQGFIALCSDPGAGKTFLAIDWALSIASGRDWCGRKVSQGPVVYVLGEGGSGIGPRFKAWQIARGDYPKQSVLTIREPVQLHRPGDKDLLMDLIAKSGIKPRLVVFDTLAKCFAGGEENSAKEVGMWVDGAFPLQKEYGATVLVLHHLTKHTSEVRGSSSLKGAADAIVRIRKNAAGIVTVDCEKQKDAEAFKQFALTTKVVPDAESLILESTDAVSEGIQRWGIFGITTLKALATFPDGAKSAEWRLKAGAKERTFHTHRHSLVRNKYVSLAEGGIYKLTDTGKTATADALPLAAVA